MEMNNKTIQKLTNKELNDLGCGLIGIYTFIGDLKSRKQGFTTVKKSEKEFHFISKTNENVRFEFIKTADTGMGMLKPQWAVRRKVNHEYEEFWQILWGCDFLKN